MFEYVIFTILLWLVDNLTVFSNLLIYLLVDYQWNMSFYWWPIWYFVFSATMVINEKGVTTRLSDSNYVQREAIAKTLLTPSVSTSYLLKPKTVCWSEVLLCTRPLLDQWLWVEQCRNTTATAPGSYHTVRHGSVKTGQGKGGRGRQTKASW